MCKLPKWIRLGVISILMLGFVSAAWGGSFIFSLMSDGETLNNQDYIMHPEGYTGVETAVTVNLCIVPNVPAGTNIHALAMVNSVKHIAAMMTAKAGTTGNLLVGATGDAVPGTDVDFESVALHEVGHCLGLAHPNAATEATSLVAADRDYTKAAATDGTLDVAPGVDTIKGSSDDVRGDDLNVHWFRIDTNDPCNAPASAVFDSTTYTVAGALPVGDLFAANADSTVCAAQAPPAVSTEAVMQQGTFFGEAQRELGYDDEAMLKLAMSGLDEIQGTADDYTLTVVSLGISDSAACNINLSFDDTETGFAVCKTSFSTVTGGNADHGNITVANAFFSDASTPYFFNTTPVQLQSFSVD